MPALYDNLGFNHNIALDLPFRQGLLTNPLDVSKVRHVMTMVDPGTGSFIWGNEPSGCPNLGFVSVGPGATQGVYIECAGATCPDLNFTTEDYTLWGWFHYHSSSYSVCLLNRGLPNVEGWELYIYGNILQLRHNHAGGATTTTGAYYQGIAAHVNTFGLFGMSRSGGTAQIYLNGLPVTTVVSAGGLIDPEPSVRDLVIGAQTTKDRDWFDGFMWRPRITDGLALSDEDHQNVFQLEKHWFGL